MFSDSRQTEDMDISPGSTPSNSRPGSRPGSRVSTPIAHSSHASLTSANVSQIDNMLLVPLDIVKICLPSLNLHVMYA